MMKLKLATFLPKALGLDLIVNLNIFLEIS